MKKIAYILALVIFVLLLPPQHLRAEDEDPLGRLTISFFNKEDKPPAVPYMDIIFVGIKKNEMKQIMTWRAEISAAIEEFGGVREVKDYEKVGKVVTEYIERFTSTGAIAIDIRFPREKKGLILRNKKPDKIGI